MVTTQVEEERAKAYVTSFKWTKSLKLGGIEFQLFQHLGKVSTNFQAIYLTDVLLLL